MKRDVLIKDRLKARPPVEIEEAMREGMSDTSTVKRTKAGIRIKRLKDLLILF